MCPLPSLHAEQPNALSPANLLSCVPMSRLHRDRAGATYTIADLLTYNLKQFPEIRFVKIYDENGGTQNPNGLSDSIPVCLQP
jgi:hypothetical protein